MKHPTRGPEEPARESNRSSGLSGGKSPQGAARASRERILEKHWTHLPAHLGLHVTRGAIPEELPGAEHPWDWIEVTPQTAVVHFGNGVRLLVRDGREVIIQWDDESDPEGDPSWILQGWAVTLASLQRGNLSLHAATVRIGDKVVAIAGNRGAGKSTTAMGLRRRGHQLLVDDVTILEFRGNEAWTTPYARNVHLLPDAADALGVDFDSLPPLAMGRDKAAFRAEDPPIEPHHIDLIVVLAAGVEAGSSVASSEGDTAPTEPSLTQAHGAARLAELIEHAGRDGVAPLILGHARYFTLLASLANSAPVHILRRPEEGWFLEEVLDLVEGLAAGND